MVVVSLRHCNSLVCFFCLAAVPWCTTQLCAKLAGKLRILHVAVMQRTVVNGICANALQELLESLHQRLGFRSMRSAYRIALRRGRTLAANMDIVLLLYCAAGKTASASALRFQTSFTVHAAFLLASAATSGCRSKNSSSVKNSIESAGPNGRVRPRWMPPSFTLGRCWIVGIEQWRVAVSLVSDTDETDQHSRQTDADRTCRL